MNGVAAAVAVSVFAALCTAATNPGVHPFSFKAAETSAFAKHACGDHVIDTASHFLDSVAGTCYDVRAAMPSCSTLTRALTLAACQRLRSKSPTPRARACGRRPAYLESVLCADSLLRADPNAGHRMRLCTGRGE